MEERNANKREISLGENFDVAVNVKGVRVEMRPDGSILTCTDIAVNVLLHANDDAPRAVPKVPEPGTKMKDGTIYAGVSPDTGTALYVLPQDAPLVMKWKEAMQYAANLDAHGHRDWKLPSKTELDMLFENRAKIGGFNETGSIPAGYYWSSSENALNNAWYQRFSGGFQFNVNKNNGLSVRCVRG